MGSSLEAPHDPGNITEHVVTHMWKPVHMRRPWPVLMS